MFDAFCVKRCPPRRIDCLAPARRACVLRPRSALLHAIVSCRAEPVLEGVGADRSEGRSRSAQRNRDVGAAGWQHGPQPRRAVRHRGAVGAHGPARRLPRPRCEPQAALAQCHSFCVCQAHSDFRALPQTSPSFRPGLRPRCCSQTTAPTSAKSSRRHVPPHFFI